MLIFGQGCSTLLKHFIPYHILHHFVVYYIFSIVLSFCLTLIMVYPPGGIRVRPTWINERPYLVLEKSWSFIDENQS